MESRQLGIESSAVEIAAAIRAREISSREIVTACLDRIESVNPRLNAVVQRAPTSLDEAHAADAALARGAPVGPLHGVPFTVKDWIETRGLVCAAGNAERRDFVPKRDASDAAPTRARYDETD